MIQDKKLISSAMVKIISRHGPMDGTFEQRINDFIKDKNIYDIQYKAGSDYDVVMIVY